MQPYFFPHIAYYQLIQAVDTFVVYDDVNFIKKGWINRNRIFCNGKPIWLSVPLSKASQNKKIFETLINWDPRWIKKTIISLEQNYRKAPYYADIIPLVNEIFQTNYQTIDGLAFQSIKTISDFLDIKTRFVRSSRIYNNGFLAGQDRIVDICKKENAEIYINASGGRPLYSYDNFSEEGIELFFIKSICPPHMNERELISCGLSIIDVLMHCGQKGTQSLLENCVFER